MKSKMLLIVGAVLLTSCAAVNKVETAKTLGIYGPGVLQNPVVADLDVRETKVSGSATGSSTAPNVVKNMALADAIKKANADVLVEPTFELSTKGGKTTATVQGFPATYRNFRNATPADSLLIQSGHMHYARTAVVDDAPAKRGGGGVAVVVTLVLLAIAGVIAAL